MAYALCFQLADPLLLGVPNSAKPICTAAHLTHQLKEGGNLLRWQPFVPHFCPMTNAYLSCTAWSASLWEIIIVYFPDSENGKVSEWSGMMPQFKLRPWVYSKVGMVPGTWALQVRNGSSPSCLQTQPETHLPISLLSYLDMTGQGPAHLPFI